MPPRLEPQWRDRICARTDERIFDCAIAQLAQAAIDRRYPGLVEFYTPEDLTRHIAEAARADLADAEVGCDGAEVRWQAGSHRWYDVFQALARDDDPGDRPHPDTDAWLARGLDLTGLSAADQLAALRRMPLTWNPDRTAIDGTGDPPEHLRLTAALSDAPTPKERFIESVLPYLQFANGWPLIRRPVSDDR